MNFLENRTIGAYLDQTAKILEKREPVIIGEWPSIKSFKAFVKI
jgi:hypothetical protein